MSNNKDPKSQIAIGVSSIMVPLVWTWLHSVEQFQNFFLDKPAQEFVASMFISVILACLVGGIVYGLLAAIEQAFE